MTRVMANFLFRLVLVCFHLTLAQALEYNHRWNAEPDSRACDQLEQPQDSLPPVPKSQPIAEKA